MDVYFPPIALLQTNLYRYPTLVLNYRINKEIILSEEKNSNLLVWIIVFVVGGIFIVMVGSFNPESSSITEKTIQTESKAVNLTQPADTSAKQKKEIK